MTAFQRIARLAMIEVIQADIPADRDELLAVMLGMALRALVVAPRLAHPHLIHQSRVQTLVRREPLLDLRVTDPTPALSTRPRVALRAQPGSARRTSVLSPPDRGTVPRGTARSLRLRDCGMPDRAGDCTRA